MERLNSTAPVLLQECLDLIEQTLRLDTCLLVEVGPGTPPRIVSRSRGTPEAVQADDLGAWAAFALWHPEPIRMVQFRRETPFAMPEALRQQGAGTAFSARLEIEGRVCAVLLGAAKSTHLWTADRLGFLDQMRSVISTAVELIGSPTSGPGLAHVAAVIEDSPVIIRVKTFDGRYLLVNRGFRRAFGLEPEQVIGHTDVELFGHAAESHAAREGAVREGASPVEYDEDLTLTDGRHVFRTIKFQLLDAERSPYAVCGLSIDVTQQRAMEEELRQADEKWKLVSRATQDTVWDWDVRTDQIDWNEGLTLVFGYPPEVVRSDLDWWYQRVHPDDRDRTLASLRGTISDRRQHWSSEYRFRGFDGEDRYVLDRGWVVYDEHGEPLRMIGAMLDLTQRIRSEQERAVLYAEAQEAVRARDEFLAIASHELKTPLTTLHLYLQYLRTEVEKQLAGEFSPKRLGYKIEAADRQVRRMSELVNNLLDISRITAGRMELALETIDLVELVREQIGRFSEQFARAGSEVRLSAPEAVVGRWDPLRIEQVVTNLLSNALKYGKQKPVEVTIEATEDSARLVVRDHGIGIAPEDQARIFERFERAVSVRHFGGFGLGLWIVRRILAAHGGSIAVESVPGVGSTFTVELPRVSAPATLEGVTPGELLM